MGFDDEGSVGIQRTLFLGLQDGFDFLQDLRRGDVGFTGDEECEVICDDLFWMDDVGGVLADLFIETGDLFETEQACFGAGDRWFGIG